MSIHRSSVRSFLVVASLALAAAAGTPACSDDDGGSSSAGAGGTGSGAVGGPAVGPADAHCGATRVVVDFNACTSGSAGHDHAEAGAGGEAGAAGEAGHDHGGEAGAAGEAGHDHGGEAGAAGEGGAAGHDHGEAGAAGEADHDHEAATLYGSEGDDDECKYFVQWSSTPVVLGKDVTLTVKLSTLADSKAAPGANPYIEVYLDETHAATPTWGSAVETEPGTYTIGPVKFDKAGLWTVRYHFFGNCADGETSPHGHAAFFVNVPE